MEMVDRALARRRSELLLLLLLKEEVDERLQLLLEHVDAGVDGDGEEAEEGEQGKSILAGEGGGVGSSSSGKKTRRRPMSQFSVALLLCLLHFVEMPIFLGPKNVEVSASWE